MLTTAKIAIATSSSSSVKPRARRACTAGITRLPPPAAPVILRRVGFVTPARPSGVVGQRRRRPLWSPVGGRPARPARLPRSARRRSGGRDRGAVEADRAWRASVIGRIRKPDADVHAAHALDRGLGDLHGPAPALSANSISSDGLADLGGAVMQPALGHRGSSRSSARASSRADRCRCAPPG